MSTWQSRAPFYHWFRRVWPISRFYADECWEIENHLDLIPDPPGLTLDLGSGIGDSLQLLTAARKVVLDLSLAMLIRISPDENQHRVVGRIEQLPVRREHFDLITCIGVSEYLPDKARILRQIFDALKPGGFTIITFSPISWPSRLRNLLGKRIYPLAGSTAHDLIAAQGFFIVRVSKTRLQSQYLLQKL